MMQKLPTRRAGPRGGLPDGQSPPLFLGVICLAPAEAIVARFRATGLAIAMLVAGFAHIAIAAGGISSDLREATISAALGSLWLVSAALLGLAARGV